MFQDRTGLMGVLFENPLYIYIASMTGKLGNFPKVMKVAYSSRSTCIIHNMGDQLYLSKNECYFLTQYDHGRTDPTVTAVWYKLSKRSDEQVDRHSAVKLMNEICRPIDERSSWYPIIILRFATNLKNAQKLRKNLKGPPQVN